MGVPKSRKLGLPRLWSPITLQADLWLRCGPKQSCSSPQELSNDMLHVVCRQINRVDSWLFIVRSQIGSLTPTPSFAHNLCFRCLNEQCEPISDIYVSRAFQWYKENHKPLSFDPSNRSLKFWKSTGTPSPKVGVALGVWASLPHTFLHSQEYVMLLPGFFLARNLTMPLPWLLGFLPLSPQPCNPFALVASPKLGLRQWTFHGCPTCTHSILWQCEKCVEGFLWCAWS